MIKQRKFLIISLISIIIIFLVLVAAYLNFKSSADVVSSCSGNDKTIVSSESGGNGSFETLKSIESAKLNENLDSPADGTWLHAPISFVPTIENNRLILGSHDGDKNKRPQNPEIDFKYTLQKNKLYEVDIDFETDYGINQDKVTAEVGIKRKNNSGGLFPLFAPSQIRAVDDGVITTHKAYFSPLKTSLEYSGVDAPDYFYIALSNRVEGEEIPAASLKIKKVSIKESCQSDIAKNYPKIYKDIVTSLTQAGKVFFANHKGIPWNINEPNKSASNNATGPRAADVVPFTLYQHDTDNLDPYFVPFQSEVLPADADTGNILPIEIEAAKGESKNLYFSAHDNTSLSSLDVVSAPYLSLISGVAGSSIPTAEVFSLRYTARRPRESFTGTYTVQNEIVEPFTSMQPTLLGNLTSGRNQSFLLTTKVSKDTPAGWYSTTVAVSANNSQKIIPVKIRVRDFALDNLPSQRIVYPQTDRWHQSCNLSNTKGCSAARAQIDAELEHFLEAGFNGFALESPDGNGYGAPLGEIQCGSKSCKSATAPQNITSIKFSPEIEYFIKKAGQDARTTSKFIINYENLVGMIMQKNKLIEPNESTKYLKQAIMLGLIDKPETGENSTISVLSTVEIDTVKNQALAVIKSTDTQIGNLTSRKNFWMIKPVDEGGAGGELQIGKFIIDIANSIGVKSFINGSKLIAQQNVSNSVPFDTIAINGALNQSIVDKIGADKLSVYGTGAYDLELGNEIRNRFASGFGSYQYGVTNLFFWKYIEGKFDSNQVNDFKNNLSSGSGRVWNTEFYNNSSYQQSYRDYYGQSGIVEQLATKNKYQNISSLQFIGLQQANIDLGYLQTYEKLVGRDAVIARLNSLPDDLKIPLESRTVFGTNMSKSKLDAIRNILGDEIEKELASRS